MKVRKVILWSIQDIIGNINQLLITTDDFLSNFDRKIQTDVGILDFSRAFDTVPHERLVGKFSSIGITGPLNSWIKAFLTGSP